MATDSVLPFPASAPSCKVCEIPALLGTSPAALQLRSQLRRVGPYFRTALLTGESGCGQEDVAHGLHQYSPVADRPFALLPAAETERRFAAQNLQTSTDAPEGLLYLPEIDRLSRDAQAGLLKLLRDRSAPRIVVYARRGLRPLVSAGTLSPELAGALGALRITLPTLRERAQDIPEVLRHFLRCAADNLHSRPVYLAETFPEAAMRYAWPGNFTQLRLAMGWLVENRAGSSLRPEDLRAAIDAISLTPPSEASAEPCLIPLDQVVQQHIRSVLVACNGNKLRAAEILGISRSTLYRMLESPLGSGPLALAG
jgi:two-component system response regulator HydG